MFVTKFDFYNYFCSRDIASTRCLFIVVIIFRDHGNVKCEP